MDWLDAEVVDDQDAIDAMLAEDPSLRLSEQFRNVIVVDNLPSIGAEKAKKLLGVVSKIFKQFASNLVPEDVEMPIGADNKTAGFCFISFDNEKQARQACQATDGYKLDKNHIFSVNLYSDLDRLRELQDEYKEPEETQYADREDLYAWLADAQLRDQYVIRHQANTEVLWMDAIEQDVDYDGEKEKAQGKNWCENYVRWSPQGTYLATFHKQGVAIWGGKSWEKIQRFAHKDVWRMGFSPCEQYMVSWDGRDDPAVKSIKLFDVRSGACVREFAAKRGEQWPFLKWSHDDAFFGRLEVEKGTIAVYETPSMKLHNKRSVKAPGAQDFFWSPGGLKQANGAPALPLIGYWAGEHENTAAVIKMISFPDRAEVCTKNIFNVDNCKIHWQDSGDFMCVQVSRSSKSGKTTYTNFELFRMNDPNVPVEMLEQKEPVLDFAWEPSGSRFSVIYGDRPTQHKIGFYEMGGLTGGRDVSELYCLDTKPSNKVYWAPHGGNCILATMGTINNTIEFFNVDDNSTMNTSEHFMCNQISWDPSGRFVCTAVVQPLFGGEGGARYAMENGYRLSSFQGVQLAQHQKNFFYMMYWRPRPKSLLTVVERDHVAKNLKKYVQKYEKADYLKKNAADIEARRIKENQIREFLDAMAGRHDQFVKWEDDRRGLGWSEAEDRVVYQEERVLREVLLDEEETVMPSSN